MSLHRPDITLSKEKHLITAWWHSWLPPVLIKSKCPIPKTGLFDLYKIIMVHVSLSSRHYYIEGEEFHHSLMTPLTATGLNKIKVSIPKIKLFNFYNFKQELSFPVSFIYHVLSSASRLALKETARWVPSRWVTARVRTRLLAIPMPLLL
jgi:hypothetical protein